jgi:hypothetical protein
MTTLLNVAITTAVTLQVGSTFQLRGIGAGVVPSSIAAQGTCVGTVGTSMTWWLQTSFDGGGSWCDAMAGTHTAAGRIAGIVLSSPSAGVAPTGPINDGALAAPGVTNGMFGGLWRIKYSSVGVWTLGNLRIDTFGNSMVPSV